MAEKKIIPPQTEQQYMEDVVALRRAQEQNRIFEEKKNRGPLTPSYFSTQNPIGRALGLRGDYEPNTIGQIMGGIIGAIAPFSVETGYEKQDDGFYDRTYKNVQLDTPQFIKDMSNRITDQMTAAEYGFVEPVKAAETAADFVGSGILLSAPARQAARDAGQTILGTSGGRIEPRFDIVNAPPPTTAVGDILNPLNDTANPAVGFTGPYGRTTPPVKKTSERITEAAYSPAQSSLGRMSWGNDLDKPTLTGAHILNQMKRFGVTKEELDFLGIERFLGTNPTRKFSFNQVNNVIDNQMPEIFTNMRRASDGEDLHGRTQRIVSNLYDDNYFEMDIIDLDVLGDESIRRNPSKRGRTTYAKDANHSTEEGAIGHVRGTYVNGTDLGMQGANNVMVIEEMQFDLTQDGQLKRGRNAPIIDGKSTAYATTENIAELQGSFDTILNSPEYQKYAQKKDLYVTKKAELATYDEVNDNLLVAQDAFKPDVDETYVINNAYLDADDKRLNGPKLVVQDLRESNDVNFMEAGSPNAVKAAPTDATQVKTRELNLAFPGSLREHIDATQKQLAGIDRAIAQLEASVPEGTPFPDLAQRKLNVLQAKRDIAQQQAELVGGILTAVRRLDKKFSDVTDAFQTSQAADPGNARADRRIARRRAASAFSLDDQGQPLTGEALAQFEAEYVDFPRLVDISSSEFSVEALMELGFPQEVAAKLSPRYIERLTYLKNNARSGQARQDLADEVFQLGEEVDGSPGRIAKDFFNDGKLKRNIQGKGYTEVQVNRSVLNSVIRGESLDEIEKKILVQNPPHKKNTTAAKMGYRLAIRQALKDGGDMVIFPNSRDIAQRRTSRDSTAFDDTYDAVPKSIIQEYQKMGYDVEVGVLSPGQMKDIARDPDAIQGPARYIKFIKPEQLDGTSVRMYNKGGYIRTGILSVTRKAS